MMLLVRVPLTNLCYAFVSLHVRWNQLLTTVHNLICVECNNLSIVPSPSDTEVVHIVTKYVVSSRSRAGSLLRVDASLST